MLRSLAVFFIEPTKAHYVANISRSICLSHTSVKRNLIRLVRLGLVEEKKEKKGSRKFPIYKAVMDNKVFRLHKRIHNLASIFESGLIGFLEEKLSPKSIVLFGSYQRGEDIESSDIDIFVECKEEELDLRKFETQMHRKIELHFRDNFADYTKELKNNIINGIVLSGFLEGYK